MTARVLVLNAGSSSLKYQLIDAASEDVLVSGLVERIGHDDGRVEHRTDGTVTTRDRPVPDHRAAIGAVIDLFDEVGPRLSEAAIVAVGHRVVMGGTDIDGPVLVDEALIATIDRLALLAPLHNPPNLAALLVAREALPDLPHIAVFDTAFFHDLPAAAATYALDREVAEAHGIRRYGFHGTSHQYVSATTAAFLDRGSDGLRQIVLHLGNGASASAVVDNRPVETSMGFTPLEGLVMGTRTGDIDPAVSWYLAREAGLSVNELDRLFNQRSGMVGLTGEGDLRDVHRLADDGDPHAQLALEVYLHRIRKYVGAYAAVMGGLDALTFTAGVGENDAVVRAGVAQGLGFLGITVDEGRNHSSATGTRLISPDDAPVAVLVTPTNEELAIARQTLSLL